ncbi:MAG: tetratricopeptide repeat protein, partial [Candidatus Obscuribacterales bacterium]|nr:tetratricopeptide repeat protein [Candidatus Obscuribacterales bacterium]
DLDDSVEAESEISGGSDLDALDFSQGYVGKKRQRSRTKGGHSVPRPNRGTAPEPPPKRKTLTHEQARLIDLTAKVRNEPNAALRALALSTSNPPEPLEDFEEEDAPVPLHQSFTHTMNKGFNFGWHQFGILAVSIFVVFAMFTVGLKAIEGRRHGIPSEISPVKISDRHAIPELKEADTYFNAGKYDNAKAKYEMVISLLGSKDDDFSKEQVAFAQMGVGDVFMLKSSYQDALSSYTNAEDLFRGVFGQDNFDDAACFCRMGKAYEKLGAYDDARTAYASARETFEKLGVTSGDSVEMADAIKGYARVEILGQ